LLRGPIDKALGLEPGVPGPNPSQVICWSASDAHRCLAQLKIAGSFLLRSLSECGARHSTSMKDKTAQLTALGKVS
jgi:hypothetical protein